MEIQTFCQLYGKETFEGKTERRKALMGIALQGADPIGESLFPFQVLRTFLPINLCQRKMGSKGLRVIEEKPSFGLRPSISIPNEWKASC